MAIFYLLPKDQNCLSILNAKQKDPESKLLYGDNSDNLGPSLVTHTICTFFVYTTRPAKTMGFNGSMSFWNIHVNNIYVMAMEEKDCQENYLHHANWINLRSFSLNVGWNVVKSMKSLLHQMDYKD